MGARRSFPKSEVARQGPSRARPRNAIMDRLHEIAADGELISQDMLANVMPLYRAALSMRQFRWDRQQWLPDQTMGEPGWDLCLSLFVMYCERQPINVTDAIRGAKVPYTTGLRHLQILEDAGFIDTDMDPADARNRLIRLTKYGFLQIGTAISSWIDRMG